MDNNIAQKRSETKQLSRRRIVLCDIKDQKEPKYYFYKGKENKEKKWTTIVIPNKFPVFEEDDLSKDILESNFYTKKYLLVFTI